MHLTPAAFTRRCHPICIALGESLRYQSIVTSTIVASAVPRYRYAERLRPPPYSGSYGPVPIKVVNATTRCDACGSTMYSGVRGAQRGLGIIIQEKRAERAIGYGQSNGMRGAQKGLGVIMQGQRAERSTCHE